MNKIEDMFSAYKWFYRNIGRQSYTISTYNLSALIFLQLLGCTCVAQPKIIEAIVRNCSVSDLKKNLYYLASPELEGRQTGTHGDTLTSLYVAGWYKKNGLQAPYDHGKNYFQSVLAYKQTQTSTLSFNGKNYFPSDGWNLYPKQPVEIKDVPVLYISFDSLDVFRSNLSTLDVSGKALLLKGPLFVKALTNGSIDSIEISLRKQGAVAIVWSGPRVRSVVDRMMRFGFLPSYKQPDPFIQLNGSGFPEISLTQELMAEFLAADGLTVGADGSLADTSHRNHFILKNRLNASLQQQHKEVKIPNVIGFIKGSDSTLSSIVVTAHHDHDGRNGKDIYFGAVDNASGTVAMMQLAAMVNQAVKKGMRPKRTIIFASFTGEERGLLGSFYYADHPLHNTGKTHAVLNLDMLGRVDTFYSGKRADSNYAYILVKDSLNRGLRKALYNANRPFINLKLDTYYEDPRYERRMLVGSDLYPFFLKGIPFVDINCGFCKDYHEPTDTPEKINYDLLAKQTQLAFLTLWNMAADESLAKKGS